MLTQRFEGIPTPLEIWDVLREWRTRIFQPSVSYWFIVPDGFWIGFAVGNLPLIYAL
jgi:hypothetical protein